MSRLSIITENKAQTTVEELYKDLERRISASPPGLCPVDLASSFLKMCHAQSCGKCVPCRVGLGQLEKLPDTVLFYNKGAFLTCEGSPVLEDLKTLEKEGTKICTCGTCLDFYKMKEKLAVGTIVNMYVIVETQSKADLIIKP